MILKRNLTNHIRGPIGKHVIDAPGNICISTKKYMIQISVIIEINPGRFLNTIITGDPTPGLKQSKIVPRNLVEPDSRILWKEITHTIYLREAW